MMRKRLYHSKARSIVSYKLDDIQEKCIDQTSYRNTEQITTKHLLLQNYETYRKKAKTSREQKLFLSRTYANPKKSLSRANSTSNKNYSCRQYNLASPNYMSSSLNKSKCDFFPTAYPQNKTLMQTNVNSIEIQPNIFQIFLSQLYLQKVKDLKIPINNRQKRIFISRFQSQVNSDKIAISHSDLGFNSVSVIANYLTKPSISTIKTLKLDQNNFGDAGIIRLSKCLKQCKQLEELSLVSVNLGTSGSEALFKEIIGHSSLRYLNMSSSETKGRNKIGTTPMNIFKEVLKHKNCKLTSINLSNACIGSDGFYLLCLGLHNYPNQLTLLNVASNQIRIREQDLQKIRSKLQNTRIRKLELQNNFLQNFGAHIIGYLLGIKYGQNQISKTTVYVDLSNNGIKSKGLQSLCMPLSQNHKIQQLYLANNKLCQGEGFYTIRYFLTHNWSLHRLCLKKSIQESLNLKYVAEGLENNRSLRWLDISQNKFPPSIFSDFFRSIIENKSLRTLKMDACQIGDKHISMAYNSLKCNNSLQSISANNNYVNSKGAKMILKLLMENKRICEIFLRKNCIDIHLLKEITYQSKENIAYIMNEGDPDLNYYEYAERMQESHCSNLIKTVNELEKKSNQLKIKSAIEKIAEKDVEIDEIQKQIENQNKMIKYLQKRLSQRNKQRQSDKNPRDLNFATEVEIL